MKKILWTIAVIVVVVLLGVYFSQSSGSKIRTPKRRVFQDTDENPDPFVYSSRAVELELAVPRSRDWRLISHPNHFFIQPFTEEKVIEIQNREKQFFGEVFKQKAYSDVAVENFVKKWGRLEVRKGSNVPATRVKLGGLTAERREWVFREPSDQIPTRCISFTVRRGDDLYYFFFASPEELFKELQSEFETIVKSIRFP